MSNSGSWRTVASLALLGLSGCGGGGAGDTGTSGPPVAAVPSPAPTASPISHTPLPLPGADPNAGATATTPSLLTPPTAFALPASERIAVTEKVVASFDAPWAMAFLPDGRLLVTERPTWPRTPDAVPAVRLVTQAGAVSAPLSGLPANVGVMDVVLHPQYASNHLVYFTIFEEDRSAPRIGRSASDATRQPTGIAVVAATLALDGAGSARLNDAHILWRQTPYTVGPIGSGQPGGRLAFSPDGRYLFVSAGDRTEYEGTQSDLTGFDQLMELDDDLGKIVRLNADGSLPSDNPLVNIPGARADIWSLGHRNPYGLAFAPDGKLWEAEMGPMGGDEFNLIKSGLNYGWPLVSYGSNYGGADDRNPIPGDGFEAAAFWWTPVIAPGGLIFYTGTRFPALTGDALIAGMVSEGLVRVRVTDNRAAEVQRIPLGARIRAVAQGPDGAIWVLEDGPNGHLARLDPV